MNNVNLYYEDFIDLFNFYNLNSNENQFMKFLNNYNSEFRYLDKEYIKQELIRYSDFDKLLKLVIWDSNLYHKGVEKIFNIVLKLLVIKIDNDINNIIINDRETFDKNQFITFSLNLLVYVFKENKKENYLEIIYLLNKNILEKYFYTKNIDIEIKKKEINYYFNTKINLFSNWENTPIFLKYIIPFSSYIPTNIDYIEKLIKIFSNSEYIDLIKNNNKIFTTKELQEKGKEGLQKIFNKFNILNNSKMLVELKKILIIDDIDRLDNFFYLVIGYLYLKCNNEFQKLINIFFNKFNINKLMLEEDALEKINILSGAFLATEKIFKNRFGINLPSSFANKPYMTSDVALKEYIDQNIQNVKQLILNFLNTYYKNKYDNIDLFVSFFQIDNTDKWFWIHKIIAVFIDLLQNDKEMFEKCQNINKFFYEQLYNFENNLYNYHLKCHSNSKYEKQILLDSFDSRKVQNNLKEYFSNFDFNINYTNIDPIVLIDNNMLSVINRSKFAYYEQLGDILYSVIIHDLILDAKLEYIENYQQYYMSAFFQNKLAITFDLSQYIQSNGLHFGEKEKFENADYLEVLLYQIYKTNDYSTAKNFLIELLSKNDFIKDISQEQKKHPCLNDWKKAYPHDFNFSQMGLFYHNTTLTIDFYNNLKRNLIKEIIQLRKLETNNDKTKYLNDKYIIDINKKGRKKYIYEELLFATHLIDSSYELINECYRLFKKDSDTFILNTEKLINKND